MTQTDRPLSDAEQVELAAQRANARIQSTRAPVKAGGVTTAICSVLLIVTLLAADAPRAAVGGFWLVVWLVMTLWVGVSLRREMRNKVHMFEEAIRANRVREIRLQSTRVVEFEEKEDEGACYAFEHDDNSVVFIMGQEFYEGDDFPNMDFSIVEILGERGQLIDELLIKRGRKLQPERVIPATLKNRLELPSPLTIVPVPLERLETSLPSAG
jgi:hypothetical protein